MPSRLPVAAVRQPVADTAGIDADLADNGVAADGDQSGLATVVEGAAAEGVELSVVVVEAGTGEELRDLAQQLAQERGGTVLVLSPGSVGAWSADDPAGAEQAVEVVPGGDDAAAAQAFVDELTDPGPPWLAIVLAGAALVAVVGVGGRWWERRRRRRKETAALAAEGVRLRDEVAGMADEMLSIEQSIGLQSNGELHAEFSSAAVEYRDLAHLVERDPTTRREADERSARVRTLRERVDRLDAAVDR